MKQRTKSTRRTGVRCLTPPHSILLTALIFGAVLLTGSLASAAADSDLDPSFDGDGIVTTSHHEFQQINDIVIQPDGKIVAAGHGGILHGNTQEPLSMMVVRYNNDGSLDSTFGAGGIVTTSIGSYAKAWAVALQADGKILVGGRSGSFLQPDFTLVRYHADGSLDNTFGSGGIVTTTSFGGFSQITDVVVQTDGKIVVAGDANLPGAPFITYVTALARYNPDGSLDLTFDADGVSQVNPAVFGGLTPSAPQGIALQTDQKIVVGQTCVSDSVIELCVSRYNSDGSFDNTFDGDGLATTTFDSSSASFGDALRIQPDGKIVAAGLSVSPSGGVPALARYNSDGSLDNTFDGDGRVTTFNSLQFRLEALALQPSGKIVIAGVGFFFTPSFSSAMTLARYNSDGSLDESFGNGGFVTTFVGTDSAANAVAVQSDGRIVAAGFGNSQGSEEATFSDFALVRYGAAVNHAPVVTITGPASGSAFAVNTPVNFTGTFTDDPGDTHAIAWFFESLTQPQIIVVPVLDAAAGSVNTTYTFTEAGVYKVSLRVMDNNFLSGIATTVNGLDAFVVIFDPDGGWVGGGGWIDSPPGALALAPAATGKATFGFVSRYQNSTNVPTGNVSFRFDSLNFQSASYEWLVVSGNKIQCRGVGTINGGGSYHFLLSAIDDNQPSGGGPDKFRIRIWSDSAGLIYDNQLNAPESADPTATLGAGNIVIHQ